MYLILSALQSPLREAEYCRPLLDGHHYHVPHLLNSELP